MDESCKPQVIYVVFDLKLKNNILYKTIKFTNAEIEALKNMLNSYVSYMLASGASEDYIEVRICKSLIEKLDKGE